MKNSKTEGAQKMTAGTKVKIHITKAKPSKDPKTGGPGNGCRPTGQI